MYEYKTVVYKEGSVSTMRAQNINPARFDHLLNSYAKKGWKLKDIERDSQRTFFGGKREAYLIVFERIINS